MKGSFVIYSIVFVSINFHDFTLSLEKPEEISPEMYCAGCQQTVKELDFILRRKPTRGMGETVTRALKSVCKLENFQKTELNAEKLLAVCKHIKGDEEMEEVLIREYGRKHELGQKTTYLDMTQKICGKVLKACQAVPILEVDDEEGGITYNPETEEFEVKYGSKVRMPNPVKYTEDQDQVPKQENLGHLDKEEKLSHIHSHEEL